MYENLTKWAAKNNMQFKVNVTPVSIHKYEAELWMCDKCDGFFGAECVTIHSDGTVFWHGYRFRLRKNEAFVDRFVNEFTTIERPESTDWVGYDDSPAFVLPVYWRSEKAFVDGTKGLMFWLDKATSEDVEAMTEAGCKMLKSHPEYAPEMVFDVVFVPNGVRFSYC